MDTPSGTSPRQIALDSPGGRAIFGGFTIAPERVVNGFLPRRCRQIQINPAHKTRTAVQAAIVLDMPQLVAAMLIGPDHVIGCS
jgi:hypothetical protein